LGRRRHRQNLRHVAPVRAREADQAVDAVADHKALGFGQELGQPVQVTVDVYVAGARTPICELIVQQRITA